LDEAPREPAWQAASRVETAVLQLLQFLERVPGRPAIERVKYHLGWIGLLAAKLFRDHLPLGGLGWLLAGGVAYTTGVAFYARKRLPFHHLIWHVFVLAGSGCHFCAVFWYARA
jgi:hemolysin III